MARRTKIRKIMKTNWLHRRNAFWMISPFEAILVFLIGGVLAMVSILYLAVRGIL